MDPHSNPIKSREYLALGLPVVATAVPQLEQFADVILIAEHQDDFVAKVRTALRGDAPANPRTAPGRGAGTSWDDRADELDATRRVEPGLAMCGIVGIRRFDGRSVSVQLLRQMADQLVHRGPDDDGYWVDGSVGFGHRRLSIIDVGNSAQPMTSADGRHHITFNGEIFNYRELRHGCSYPFRTDGDTEAILALHQLHGERRRRAPPGPVRLRPLRR